MTPRELSQLFHTPAGTVMVVSDAAVEAAAGALGSVASLLITYPLKTIYTLQALNSSKAAPANAGSAGPDNSILGIVMQYKLKGLYVGVGPNVLVSVKP